MGCANSSQSAGKNSGKKKGKGAKGKRGTKHSKENEFSEVLDTTSSKGGKKSLQASGSRHKKKGQGSLENSTRSGALSGSISKSASYPSSSGQQHANNKRSTRPNEHTGVHGGLEEQRTWKSRTSSACEDQSTEDPSTRSQVSQGPTLEYFERMSNQDRLSNVGMNSRHVLANSGKGNSNPFGASGNRGRPPPEQEEEEEDDAPEPEQDGGNGQKLDFETAEGGGDDGQQDSVRPPSTIGAPLPTGGSGTMKGDDRGRMGSDSLEAIQEQPHLVASSPQPVQPQQVESPQTSRNPPNDAPDQGQGSPNNDSIFGDDDDFDEEPGRRCSMQTSEASDAGSVGQTYIRKNVEEEPKQNIANAGNPYSRKNVRRHGSEEDLWVVIRNYVYDLTEFQHNHPGGSWPLLQVGGKDATKSFEAQHGAGYLQYLTQYRLGPVPNDEKM